MILRIAITALALLGAFLAFGFYVGSTPEGKEKQRKRDAISMCWSEQGRKSNSAGEAQFIAGACERMESDYIAKYGGRP
jgi:hypothetical protein